LESQFLKFLKNFWNFRQCNLLANSSIFENLNFLDLKSEILEILNNFTCLMTNVTKAINGKADHDKKKEECKRRYVIFLRKWVIKEEE